MATLRIDLKPGESVSIGGAVVTLEQKTGQVARISIEADRSVPVKRIQRPTPSAIAAEFGLPAAT